MWPISLRPMVARTHWLAKDTANNLWAGGDNGTGELGIGSSVGGIHSPTMITTDSLGNRLHFISANCSATPFGGYWASEGYKHR